MKHDNLRAVRTITVRELRQRWPRGKALIQTEGEILITRDAKRVAKLVRIVEPRTTRPRFDSRKHAAWQTRVGGRRVVRWVDEFLARERSAR